MVRQILLLKFQALGFVEGVSSGFYQLVLVGMLVARAFCVEVECRHPRGHAGCARQCLNGGGWCSAALRLGGVDFTFVHPGPGHFVTDELSLLYKELRAQVRA